MWVAIFVDHPVQEHEAVVLMILCESTGPDWQTIEVSRKPEKIHLFTFSYPGSQLNFSEVFLKISVNFREISPKFSSKSPLNLHHFKYVHEY